MMTNMKTVLFTDESRTLPNDSAGLTKGWVFNGDNCAVGIRRQQSGSVVMIWGGMIANEATAIHFCDLSWFFNHTFDRIHIPMV